jgi:hypothetical protein
MEVYEEHAEMVHAEITRLTEATQFLNGLVSFPTQNSFAYFAIPLTRSMHEIFVLPLCLEGIIELI